MSEFRRSLLEASKKHNNIFAEAYFYLPFKDAQTVIDVNHGISPTVNTGSLMSDGYYTDGVNQYLRYNDSNFINSIGNEITVYLEFIPYELSRNQYILDIDKLSVYGASTHFLSLFIYKSKNNKFGLTLCPYDDTNYMDDEIYNSPIVNYGEQYKIVIKYNRNSGVLKCFINGAISTYENFYCTVHQTQLDIGRNSGRNDRYAKATFKTVAVWDKVLTDDECISLTT